MTGLKNEKGRIEFLNGGLEIRFEEIFICARAFWEFSTHRSTLSAWRMFVRVKVLHERIIYGNVRCRSDISLNVFLCPMMLILF